MNLFPKRGRVFENEGKWVIPVCIIAQMLTNIEEKEVTDVNRRREEIH